MTSAALCGDQSFFCASTDLLTILMSHASIQFESLSSLSRIRVSYISLILQLHTSVRGLVLLDSLNLFSCFSLVLASAKSCSCFSCPFSFSFFCCFADVAYVDSDRGFFTPTTVDPRSVPKPTEISKRWFTFLSTPHHTTLTQSSQPISASVDPRVDGSAHRFVNRCFGRQVFRRGE